MGDRQEHLDRFYFEHGPCCAGCDWWRSISSLIGECTRSAPVSGRERQSMLGVDQSSAPLDAGHVLTSRQHICGEFKDDFDWSSLSLAYQKRIGAQAIRSLELSGQREAGGGEKVGGRGG